MTINSENRGKVAVQIVAILLITSIQNLSLEHHLEGFPIIPEGLMNSLHLMNITGHFSGDAVQQQVQIS